MTMFTSWKKIKN